MQHGRDRPGRPHSWWIKRISPELAARDRYEQRNSAAFVQAAFKDIQCRVDVGLASTVVDIGCGEGGLLRQLRQVGWGSRHVGIDPNAPTAPSNGVEFIVAYADDVVDWLAEITDDVTVLSTLSLGLWPDPAHTLVAIMGAGPNVKGLFISDLVRPMSQAAIDTWLSFAHDPIEREYLEDQAEILLTPKRWVQLVSSLRSTYSDLEVQLTSFDVRMAGVQARSWDPMHTEDMADFLSNVGVPTGLTVYFSRLDKNCS
ncbi:class I SAM-dependent methyltransferase [Kocuria sp.]|uniref:class I SAM-dependent methyltransferase n=1 Tax=Kocuria sp. TaxID=1871328 RepID=UPI0026DF2D3E|nr:class I SAM-dependent methyltransferase [Kocuria sp.]MDO5619162.1 class I SAM-dependent methyltransferase [Kocuria sp.]